MREKTSRCVFVGDFNVSKASLSDIFVSWHIDQFNLKRSRRQSYRQIICALVISNSVLVLVWRRSVDN